MTFKTYLSKRLHEASDNNSDIKDKIIDFFVKNKDPKDSDIHKMANEIDIEPDEFESIIYSLLSDFWSEGKFNKNGGDIDPKELAMGIEVEKEHTDSEEMATRIARDHISEISDYYTRLKKMEADAGIKD